MLTPSELITSPVISILFLEHNDLVSRTATYDDYLHSIWFGYSTPFTKHFMAWSC